MLLSGYGYYPSLWPGIVPISVLGKQAFLQLSPASQQCSVGSSTDRQPHCLQGVLGHTTWLFLSHWLIQTSDTADVQSRGRLCVSFSLGMVCHGLPPYCNLCIGEGGLYCKWLWSVMVKGRGELYMEGKVCTWGKEVCTGGERSGGFGEGSIYGERGDLRWESVVLGGL